MGTLVAFITGAAALAGRWLVGRFKLSVASDETAKNLLETMQEELKEVRLDVKWQKTRMDSEVTRGEERQKQIDNLQGKVQTLEKEKEELKRHLADCNGRHDADLKRITELEGEIAKLKEEMQVLQGKGLGS